MSVLDSLPCSENQRNEMLKIAAPMVAAFLSNMDLTPHQRSVFDLMAEGLSLADILRISKEHRDALLQAGCRLLRAGELDSARATLTILLQLEPLDSRAIYALAAVMQTQGDYGAAAKLYISFLALDATNPEGYLRLGECLLANNEYGEATESFRIANRLCEGGHGSPACAEQARRMVSFLQERESVPH